MSITYLTLTAPPVMVPASGIAFTTLAPDVGQFWLPTTLHVSTQSGIPCQANVYAGGPKGQLGISPLFLKDSTTQGNNDTTTILSGQVVYAGQGITVQFTGAATNDVVTFQLTGISSDQPPPMGILPDIPGARFVFAPATPIGVPLVNQQNLALAPAQGLSLPAVFTSNLNTIVVHYTVRGDSGPNHFGVRLIMRWWGDPALTQIIAIDGIDMVSDCDQLNQTYPVKGPYLQIAFAACPAPPGDPLGYTLDLTVQAGVTGVQPFYFDGQSDGSILLKGLLYALNGSIGGSTAINPTTVNGHGNTIAPGPVSVECINNDVGAFNWQCTVSTNTFDHGIILPLLELDQRSPVGARQALFLPNAPVFVQINNTDPAAHNFIFTMLRNPNYQYG